MALTNRNGRASCVTVGLPFGRVLPNPDGSLATAGDRQQHRYLYRLAADDGGTVCGTPGLSGRVNGTASLLARVGGTGAVVGRVNGTADVVGRVAGTAAVVGRVDGTVTISRC